MGLSRIASASNKAHWALFDALSWSKDLGLFILLGVALALWQAELAKAQKLITLCLQVSNTVNGVKTISCVPISAANRLPVTTTGTSQATAPGAHEINLCVQRSQVVNGTTVYSCVPVSTTNPLPVNGG